jgi:hypothetical protein
MVSMRRLSGSRRKPKGMKISPEMSHFPVYRMGSVRSQCRTRRKRALAREVVMAAMEIPAARRRCSRNKTRMRAKATKGVADARAAASRVGSWSQEGFILSL